MLFIHFAFVENNTMIENWNMLGHEWAVEMLKQHLVRGTARHAYLFTGPPGVGRRTLALRFTQALNCPTPVAPGVPCGVCRDCRQVEAMQYPDLSIAQSENEGGTLKVERVREVRRTLMLKPYQAKYRVAIFLRFQEASEGAANALLKTLEEAPSYAVLILTADTPEQLLPTIVSRCEVLRLRSLPVQTVEANLISQGAQAGQAHLIAHISGGRPGYALRLLQDDSALGFRAERLDDMQALLVSSRVQKFKYAEKLSRDKENMRQTLLVWLSYWRDVLLCASGASAPIANVDREQDINALGKQLSLSTLWQLVKDIEGSIERLERNVNSRLLAEVLLLDLPHV